MFGAMSVSKVIEAAGSSTKLAQDLGISVPAISKWIRRGRVPVERVLEIEQRYGISRYELRPDIYGQAPATARAAA